MRTLGDVPTGGETWPPAGKIRAKCFKAEKFEAKNEKKTKAVKPYWMAGEGAYEFADLVFVTVKAMGRLSLVAQRLCGMSKTAAIPDDDGEAAGMLAKYILDHAEGCEAILTIEEQTEEFMYADGPRVGQKGTKIRQRVTYSGYEAVPVETSGDADDPLATTEGDGIPF